MQFNSTHYIKMLSTEIYAKNDIISVNTKFDEFTKLQNIFVELVVVNDRKDCLIQSLQLLHVVNRHITELNYATATIP